MRGGEGLRRQAGPQKQSASGSRMTIRTVVGIDNVLLLKWVRNACLEFIGEEKGGMCRCKIQMGDAGLREGMWGREMQPGTDAFGKWVGKVIGRVVHPVCLCCSWWLQSCDRMMWDELPGSRLSQNTQQWLLPHHGARQREQRKAAVWVRTRVVLAAYLRHDWRRASRARSEGRLHDLFDGDRIRFTGAQVEVLEWMIGRTDETGYKCCGSCRGRGLDEMRWPADRWSWSLCEVQARKLWRRYQFDECETAQGNGGGRNVKSAAVRDQLEGQVVVRLRMMSNERSWIRSSEIGRLALLDLTPAPVWKNMAQV